MNKIKNEDETHEWKSWSQDRTNEEPKIKQNRTRWENPKIEQIKNQDRQMNK